MYRQHPSEELNHLYKQRPYQGQNPELAQIIFLGLDANFMEDIDKDKERFRFTKEYLEDGVIFWETYEVHHPFIYQKQYKDGVRYHRNFAKLNLNATYAKNVSFMELLDIPTVGNTGASIKEFYKLLNIDYLKNVENVISNSRNKKVVFISGSVLNALIYIKKKFNLFKWLPTKKIKGGNKAHKIFEDEAVCIYQVFHFSASITDDHIKEIREIIDEFEDITNHYNNSVQLALAVCIKIIEDLSKVTDVRIYTWLKEPGNYYITLYPAEFMDVYELNNIEDETKRVDRKISSFITIPSGENFGTTIGLYGNDCMMIPGWCNGGDINFFQRYKENNNFQEVYDLVYKSLNIAQFQKYSKCKIFDNSKHLSLLREVLNTITHFENISFEIPCVDTPFPYETVRFSDFAEDICEYDLREPETR
jgi:hypothetical protein